MASRPISFRAAAGRPCPVCLVESKGCSATDDGLHFCRGGPSDPTEWRQLSGMADAEGFLHFRRVSDDTPRRSSKRQTDWSKIAADYAASMKGRHYIELARRLSLPETAIRLYPQIGWCEASLVGTTFTIPEFDSTGRIIGITKRMPPADPGSSRDGQQMLKGGNRGLMLVTGWRERGEPTGPLLIVEGASCAMAAAAASLSAIGRPGSDSGREYLARTLADWPADRPIIVLGENDRKEDGRWPGREGAEKLAQGLANDLSREIQVALPPVGDKDLRAWLTSDDRGETPWPDRGAQFLAAVLSAPTFAAFSPQATLDRPRPEILVTTEEFAINNEAIGALARESNIYQRGGLLVRAIQSPASKTKSLDLPSSLRIMPFEKATLREVLANVAIWKKEIRGNEDSATVDTHPPGWCVDAVIARGYWSGIRNLLSVVDHPVVRPDGSILAAEGFDQDTELFVSAGDLNLAPHLPAGGRYTLEEARRAVDVLTDAVVDFPFTEPSHRSAWIAALLTPLCRFAFSGPAPLFLIDANCPGTGKGLLCDIISIIVSGTRFAIASYSHNNEEMEKCITAAAIAGDRLILLDNINGLFGNAAMDKALTGTIWRGRLLGESKNVTMPLFATWYATGNNVTLAGDISRRIIHSKLTSTVENPDERDDFIHPNLKDWCRENRGKLVAAALAIPAAYIQAGRPRQAIPRFGSFEGWSDLVRSALVWAGLPDPAANRLAIRRESDSELGAMSFVLEKWNLVDLAESGITASEFIERVFGKGHDSGPDDYAELRDVLRGILKRVDAREFGYKMRKYQGRIISGRMLDVRISNGLRKWFVKSGAASGYIQTSSIISRSETINSGADNVTELPSAPASAPEKTLEFIGSGADGADGADTRSPHARESTQSETEKKPVRLGSGGLSAPSAPIGTNQFGSPASPPSRPPDGWLYVSRRLDTLTIVAPDAGPVVFEDVPGAPGTPFFRLTPTVFAWFARVAERMEAEFIAGRFPKDQMDVLAEGMAKLWAWVPHLDAGEASAAMASQVVELPAVPPRAAAA